MQGKQFFSKLNRKDYNNQVELILDKKEFTADIKNLILSMFYKIEIAYDDYNIVKPFAEEKSVFIEEIMRILKENCKEITLINPREEKNEEAIDGRLEVYPNIESILYGLLEISDTYFYIPNSHSLIKDAFTQFLKIGFCIDHTEVIRDFDGWSWNTDLSKARYITYNLIYQNIQMLLGNQFFQIWKSDNTLLIDYIEKILLDLEEVNEELAQNIYVLICKCILALYVENPIHKEKIEAEIQQTKQKLLKMKDKSTFLKNISEQKKAFMKEIRELDKKINNKKELEQEFIKRNEKLETNKIFSLAQLIRILKKEIKDILEKIQECNETIDPRNYTKKMKQLEEDVEIAENIEKNQYETLLSIQKDFLNLLKLKTEKAESKKEILEYIYILRYYSFLPITEEREIKEIAEINLEEVQKILYTKACNLKIIEIIHKNINFNTEILNEILDTKIINLEEIEIKFYIEENLLQIEVYEEEMLQGKKTMKIPEVKEEFVVKFDKKIKLFH